MKRATITIGDDVETAIDAYRKRQEVPPALTAVVQAALREFLERRGFAPPRRPFRIAPSKKGSGKRDVSLRHDEYLARK
jgi:hypothetical protein